MEWTDPSSNQTATELYVNGCKVTLHYAQQSNAAAIKEIKSMLLANISHKVSKNCVLGKNKV